MNQPGYFARHSLNYPQAQPRYGGYDARRNVRGHYGYENRYYGQYRQGVAHHNQGDPYTVRLRVGDREYPGTKHYGNLSISFLFYMLHLFSYGSLLFQFWTFETLFMCLVDWGWDSLICLGQGPTVQAARHDAAAKAIDHIKQLGGIDTSENPPSENGHVTEIPASSFQNDVNSELKSPISLVYEIALKRNLNVIFDVLSEKVRSDSCVCEPIETCSLTCFVCYLNLCNS